MLQNGQPIVFSGHFFWVRAAAPLPHFTPIGIYVASPSHWNPKYATEWICQTSTKWSCKVCVSTCCGQGHNSPQIHNIQQQAVQHTTIHTKSNKANISGDDCNLRMTNDLLTSKLIVSRPCPLSTCVNLHQIGSIIFKISSWQIWWQTDGRTNYQTG